MDFREAMRQALANKHAYNKELDRGHAAMVRGIKPSKTMRQAIRRKNKMAKRGYQYDETEDAETQPN